MSKPWKNLERQTAKVLNGKRNTRGGDFSRSVSDVSHPVFVIETKYRARLPYLLSRGLQQAAAYDASKVPLLILKQRGQRGSYCILKTSDFTDLLGELPAGLSDSPEQQDTTAPQERGGYEEGGEQ